ncbi:hypothetical protein [Caenimonas sp. SL110]|uniref:hypothetical protein n=1 Tax=Caenimonas sp. SL110 TaxID=1450524 RepID=UPI000652C191|nr:hypothetical protein [Caenimonas sp. SL110]
MYKILVPAGIVLAQMLAVGAYAQPKGEADPAQSKAAPSKPATPAEKAVAKADRKAEGTAAAKSKPREDAANASKGTAKAATKEERAAAKAKRKAEAASAVKKGEIKSGEK